jgi:hypothetical protein
MIASDSDMKLRSIFYLIFDEIIVKANISVALKFYESVFRCFAATCNLSQHIVKRFIAINVI